VPPISAWLLQVEGAEILRKVLDRCDAARIPTLPVKGVVTSRWLYRDVADRPITDVDIRIRPRDFARFRRMATTAGWNCLRVARSYGNLIYEFGALSLDVEAYVGPPGLCSLSVDVMIDRSERQEIVPGLSVNVPELHDHAVLLTVNAFKDKMVNAAPWAIADLERIVLPRRFGRDLFVERLRQSRVTTIGWIVAGWMESAQKNGAWAAIRAAIESRARVRRTYARLFQGLLATSGGSTMSLRLLARVGADTPGMRAEALVRALAWSAESRLRQFSKG
jgi:Uncharacterised nucleotidyltransferase